MMSLMLFSVVMTCQILVILVNPTISTNISRISTYAKLRSEIMNREVIVHKISPYFYNPEGNFSLQYSLFPIDVLDIDEINQFMTVLLYIGVSWQQTNLSWSPSEYLGVEMVELESKSMWIPKIKVAFANRDEKELPFPDDIGLSFDGTIRTKTEEYLTFRCAIIFNKYPFDSQQCSFELFFVDYGSASPTVDVDKWNSGIELLMQKFTLAGEWAIKDFWYEKVMEVSDRFHPRYIFKVKRRSTYYVITVIFPLILTSSMIPLVFLIPPETGEKISYLVALFTSSAIFLNFISDVMPRSLSSMPYLALLISEVMFQSLGAILATLYVVNRFQEELKSKTAKGKRPDKRPLGAAQVESVPMSDPVNMIEGEKEGLESGPIISNAPLRSSRCSLSCRRIDTMFFLFFLVFQIVFLGLLFGATEWLH